MKDFKQIIFIVVTFLFLAFLNIHSQVLPSEDLFSYNSIFQQKFIRISERIQAYLNIQYSCILQLYYNANQDSEIDSIGRITRVIGVTYFNNQNADAIDLIDDGKHFDNKPLDGIYGNTWSNNLSSFNSNMYKITVILDSLRIDYSTLENPVFTLPETPKIFTPAHNSTIFRNVDKFFWEIDTSADGCGIILFNSEPTIGNEFQNVIWEKKYNKNSRGRYFEKVPVNLYSNNKYTFLVWSYTDMKKINNTWKRGAYSIEWSNFYVDSISDQSNDFIVSQNFPNPFHASTIIKYYIPQNDVVVITIYDVLGNEVSQLLNEKINGGDQYISWNGKNNNGVNVSSGIYFCKVNFRNNASIKKMLLVR
jgi:hypothetical protein